MFLLCLKKVYVILFIVNRWYVFFGCWKDMDLFVVVLLEDLDFLLIDLYVMC